MLNDSFTPEDQASYWSQLQHVKNLMSNGEWWLLEDLEKKVSTLMDCPIPQQSISARVRNLREKKYGAYTVLRERLPGKRIFKYKLILNPEEDLNL